MKIPVVTAAVLIAVAVGAPVASASQLLARNANDVAARGERQRQGARHLPVEGRGPPRARVGRRQRPAVRVGPATGRALRSTTPAAGARSTGRSGRRSRTRAHRCDVELAWLVTACQASDGSYWALQSWQRTLHIYGIPTAPLARRVGASPLALDRRDREARCPLRLDVSPVPADLRPADVQGPPRLRLQPQAGRRAARRLRAEHLPRHVRLRLRKRLEARERLSHAQPDGRLLLRLLPARLAPVGPRDEVPRDRDGARCDAGRLLAGGRADDVRPARRSRGRHRPARAAARRPRLQAALKLALSSARGDRRGSPRAHAPAAERRHRRHGRRRQHIGSA